MLASAPSQAMQKRRDNGAIGMGAGGGIAESIFPKHGDVVRVSGHIDDAGVGLTDPVIARQVRQGAGLAKAGNGAHHQIRVYLPEGVPVQVVFLHHARGKVFDHHIGVPDQLMTDLLTLGRRDIHAHRLLANVVLNEVGAATVLLIG